MQYKLARYDRPACKPCESPAASPTINPIDYGRAALRKEFSGLVPAGHVEPIPPIIPTISCRVPRLIASGWERYSRLYMYAASQSVMTSAPGTGEESGFKVKDRVWIKRLNTVGVVQEVRRSSSGEVDYYLLQLAIAGAGLLSMLASPLGVEKWLNR